MGHTDSNVRFVMSSVLLVVAGCGAGAESSDPVKQRWSAREPFSSCGNVALDQGERLGEAGATEVSCMRRALASGKAAELVVTRLTQEGDPVVKYYRVTEGGTLEVYTDGTADRFGDQEWTYVECEDPDALLDESC